MRDRVLVSGPSGAGKSTLARYFASRGKKAFDGDDVDGLPQWTDMNRKPKEITKEEWTTMKGVLFCWNEKRLKEFVESFDEVYLFGSADNMYELLGYFDKLYYLRSDESLISDRLSHPARDNDFGREEPQRSLVLKTLKDYEERARKAGFEMVDASLSPEEIFDRICGSSGRS